MAHDPTNEAKRMRCPTDVLAWIPWYADGGLTEREKGAVEAHAAECSDCRAELDIVTGAAWSIDGIELPDADRLFGEITARIGSEARSSQATVIPISRGRALSGEDVARIERWVLDPRSELDAGDAADVDAGLRDIDALREGAPDREVRASAMRDEAARAGRRFGRERPSLLAAAAAIVLLAAGGFGGAFIEQLRIAAQSDGAAGTAAVAASDSASDAGSDAYQLASVPPAAGAVMQAPSLDVVFDDGVTARAIWSQLRELGVEIVAGPTNLGVYRLRLTAAAAEGREPNAADAAAIAARLVAPGSAIAIFAEPVP